jgi:hypothetical protein
MTAHASGEKVESCTLGLEPGNPIPAVINGYDMITKYRNITARKTILGSWFSIFVISATVRRSWQNVVEYGSKLSLHATHYEFFSWEPRVPEGKT